MKFLVDAMLGKLARYLRMMGYDTEYVESGVSDDDIAERAEGRILVTRDTQLASSVASSILVDSLDIEDQLRELEEEGVELELDHPKRCSVCNGILETSDEKPRHAPDSLEEIWVCSECGKHYWKGSHWDDVKNTLENLGSQS